MNQTTSKATKKKLSALAGLLIGAIAMSLAHQASASLILTIDDLSTVGIDAIIVDDADGGVGTATAVGLSNFTDGSAGDGLVTFNGAIGSFIVNVTTGLSKPFIGSTSDPRIDLNSVNVSGSAGDLVLSLTDTDFLMAGATELTLQSLIGGTTDGTVTTTYFLGAGNTEFGNTLQLGPTALGPGSFSYTASGNGAVAGAFSLSNTVMIHHNGAGDITSFDSLTRTQIPVPGTFLLLGLGLFGLRFAGRRNK